MEFSSTAIFGFFRPVVPSEKKRFCKVMNNKMLQRNSAVPPVVPSVKNVICNKLIINMLQWNSAVPCICWFGAM